ncbi:MAG: hypothetical protein IKB73_06720, partial [Ruminococcus sp.]|nr:hypothetical protein [Ruminococcus sp.]
TKPKTDITDDVIKTEEPKEVSPPANVAVDETEVIPPQESAPEENIPQEPVPKQTPPIETKPQTQKTKVDLDDIYQNAIEMREWPEVINNLKQYSRAISAAFEGSNAYVSGDYLLIDTDQEIAFQLLKKSSQRDNIRKAVSEITGKTYKLGPYKKNEAKKKKDDVLDSFIANLKGSGVNVIEE